MMEEYAECKTCSTLVCNDTGYCIPCYSLIVSSSIDATELPQFIEMVSRPGYEEEQLEKIKKLIRKGRIDVLEV